jgi:predicted MFS family arabinose efflux permease
MENCITFLAIWNILQSFGTYMFWPYGIFDVFWYISPVLVSILKQEKPGNPA